MSRWDYFFHVHMDRNGCDGEIKRMRGQRKPCPDLFPNCYVYRPSEEIGAFQWLVILLQKNRAYLTKRLRYLKRRLMVLECSGGTSYKAQRRKRR